MKYLKVLFLLLGGAALWNCTGGDTKCSDCVVIHELSDPDQLNVPNSTSASATYIQGNIFQTLLWSDPSTGEMMGYLAKDRPTITPIDSGEFAGGMSLVYEIRPEATWDNGTPILASDYVFTIKSILNPKTKCEGLKPYFDFMGDIVIDEENPKKFTIFSKTTYMLVEDFSGYWVLPEYVYDPEGIMRDFSITDLNSPSKREELKGNAEIQKFADFFNSETFQREPEGVIGSGPYKFVRWETGKRIILERKENYWADGLEGMQFKANPKSIIYKIVNSWPTAISGLKDNALDVARGVPARDFKDLEVSDKFNETYNLHTPNQMSYLYLGMNLRSPKFQEKAVRKAIAHLVNRDQIIDQLYYGLAVTTESMVHPTRAWYNPNIEPFDYNVDKAKELLSEAGWADLDGDNILDKEIDGEMVSLKINFLYNQGNDIRKNIGLLLQEEASKVGIEIDISTKEWAVFLETMDNHDFEMYVGAWVGGTKMSDPKQIYHSESAKIGGSNYPGYQSQRVDSLIDAMRVHVDEATRVAMNKKIQKEVHDDIPIVFILAPQERIVIHNRFRAETFEARPGYDEKLFDLVQEKMD